MYKDEQSLLDDLLARKNQTYGPESLKQTLAYIGNPHQKLNAIQIGGTNGKGSTTNYLRAILADNGYEVGTFTSPHLVTHRDRIRINDQMIPVEKFISYANKTLPLWDQFNLSMFEIDFLISVLYFIDEDVDYVIYEVGLGGRLDATSVLTPRVIGITNVSFDHMQILGNTLKEIAFEKAGIFKKDVPVYTTEIKEEVLKVFKDQARLKETEIIELGNVEFEFNENKILVQQPIPYSLSNQGVYQVNNSQLAIHLAFAIGIPYANCVNAIEKTQWAGRFEQVSPGIFIDGAHNQAGIEALIQTIQNYPKPWTIVFAVLKDKDYLEMIHKLKNIADEFILTEFDFPRALSVKSLHDHTIKIEADYKEAIRQAVANKSSGTVVVTGSLYFISLAREYLIQKN